MNAEISLLGIMLRLAIPISCWKQRVTWAGTGMLTKGKCWMSYRVEKRLQRNFMDRPSRMETARLKIVRLRSA